MTNILDAVNAVENKRTQIIMAIGSLLQLDYNIPTNWQGSINGLLYGKDGCTKLELGFVESDDIADTRIELHYFFGESFSIDILITPTTTEKEVSTKFLEDILHSMKPRIKHYWKVDVMPIAYDDEDVADDGFSFCVYVTTNENEDSIIDLAIQHNFITRYDYKESNINVEEITDDEYEMSFWAEDAECLD